MDAGCVAAFVSPHGFGHAARVCAVFERLAAQRPGIRLVVFTTAPKWFFDDSLAPLRAEYRPLAVDVGLVQRDSLAADIGATRRTLGDLVPPSPQRVEHAAGLLAEVGADVVLADIAPLGIAAGRARGTPTVLLENFTWDWIYAHLAGEHPDCEPVIEALGRLYAEATVHLQTPPCCRPRSGARRVAPIARRRRQRPAAVRSRLGIEAATPLVLVSMGGIEWRFGALEALESVAAHFVLIGRGPSETLPSNVTLLPHRSPLHHPDLVAASSVVVGKLGYSTVAEALDSGRRMAFVERNDFAEYGVLTDYVQARVPTRTMAADAFRAGCFAQEVRELLPVAAGAPVPATGAEDVAAVLAGLLPRGARASVPRPGG